MKTRISHLFLPSKMRKWVTVPYCTVVVQPFGVPPPLVRRGWRGDQAKAGDSWGQRLADLGQARRGEGARKLGRLAKEQLGGHSPHGI
jgi:hypothetical protein